mgnify:CR=1 FL=1
MKIIRIVVPTPLLVGTVNVYLIKEDPVTLIDVGPKTQEAVEVLQTALSKHGLDFSSVKRIVLTHAHEDHCGLAKTILDKAKNAKVFVHEWETGHLFGRFDKEENKIMLRKVGVPDDVIEQMYNFYSRIRLLTDALEEEDFQPIHDEGELEFERGVLRVFHTPGHTPGSCSFIREADRTLICGDCVLKRITPNPVLSLDPFDSKKRFASLEEYLFSLARLRSLSPTLTYGGHGDPIYEFDEIFNRYVRAIDQRQKRVIKLVPKSGATAFEIATQLFPEAIKHDSQKFLAISEAVAHLDYAVSNNKLAIEFNSNGVEFYRPL